jgi:hypothetical protein
MKNWIRKVVHYSEFRARNLSRMSFMQSHSPPKIKSIRIVDNPFPDIVPRITAAERQEQQRAKEQAQRERGEEQRRKGAKKYVPSVV